MSKKWERRKGETGPAWEAFLTYREMGLSRSAAKVAKALGKSATLMNRWSSAHGWVERAAAWDTHLDQRATAAQVQEIENMKARHVRLAEAVQKLTAAEIDKMIAASEADPGKPTLLPKDVRLLLKEGTTLERVSRGEPGEIVQHKGDVDWDRLSGDELRELKRLKQKASGG
jgi:hypothetical protein